VDWNAPGALKLRCATANADQIHTVKADLCLHGSDWIKGGTYTGKSGSCTTTTEYRCSYSRKLGCPCKLRQELPGYVGGITELKMAQPHVHNFADDTSKALSTQVKLLLQRFIGQDRTRCAAIWAAFDQGGIDIVKDFPASNKHKDQVKRQRLGWPSDRRRQSGHGKDRLK
jgi:hypothetical protein